MPFLSFRHLQQFRREYKVPDANVLRWFPGHMAGGFKKMQAKLKSVDCVIEVHDARIPLSGRNPNFKSRILGVKPYILVLNKADLLDTSTVDKIVSYLKEEESINDIVFTDCRFESSKGIKELIPAMTNLISKSQRYNRVANSEFGVMVIGVPNVGKSSLINCLRSTFIKKAGCAPVGAKAGITRSLQNRIKVSNVPPIFVFDTPGILTPTIPNVEVGMKLALCATNQDHLVGMINIADFLLYWYNKNHHLNYLDFFGEQDPCDEIGLLLARYAVKKNLFKRLKVFDGTPGLVTKPDIALAAYRFVTAFRNGNLGPVNLDADLLKWYRPS